MKIFGGFTIFIIYLLLLEYLVGIQTKNYQSIRPKNDDTLRSLNQADWNSIIHNHAIVQEFLRKLKMSKIDKKVSPTTIKQITDLSTFEPSTENATKIFTEPTIEIQTTSTEKVKMVMKEENKTRSFLDILMFGSDMDLVSQSHQMINHWIWLVDELSCVPLYKKLLLWEKFKDNRSITSFELHDFELMQNFILYVPDNELFQINVFDLEILDFLGRAKNLTRRKAAIIVYAIKTQYNESILFNSSFINVIKGLICGYPIYKLKEIPFEVVQKLNKDVFKNLWSCRKQQLEILLKKFRMDIKQWDSRQIGRIGFLATVFKPNDIKLLEPQAVEGISRETLLRMNTDIVQSFNKAQVCRMINETKLEYNIIKLDMDSSGASSIAFFSYFLLLLCIPFNI